MPLVFAACAAAETTLPWLVLAVAPPFVRLGVLELFVLGFDLVIRAPRVVLVLRFELVIGALLEVLVLRFELVIDALLEVMREIREPVVGTIPKVLLALISPVVPVPVPPVPLLVPKTEFDADPLCLPT